VTNNFNELQAGTATQINLQFQLIFGRWSLQLIRIEQTSFRLDWSCLSLENREKMHN